MKNINPHKAKHLLEFRVDFATNSPATFREFVEKYPEWIPEADTSAIFDISPSDVPYFEARNLKYSSVLQAIRNLDGGNFAVCKFDNRKRDFVVVAGSSEGTKYFSY